MTAEYFKKLFIKKTVNEYQSSIIHNGKKRYRWYDNRDLNKLSQEAFNNGEDFFYVKRIDPEIPGRHVKYELSEPIHTYSLHRCISEDEYNALVSLLEQKEVPSQ